MDGSQFDRLTKTLNSRRTALGGLLGGLTLPVVGIAPTNARSHRGPSVRAEKKRKNKKKCPADLLTCTIKQGKKKKTNCVDAQTDPLNCGGCGVTCAAGQSCQGGRCACTPGTCSSLKKTCGTWPDGCGGRTPSCGTCGTGSTPSCNGGTCATCPATCLGFGCSCANLPDGSTLCFINISANCKAPCTTDADCPADQVCVSSVTNGGTTNNQSNSLPQVCGTTLPGICTILPLCGGS